jgi:hypothetical protein
MRARRAAVCWQATAELLKNLRSLGLGCAGTKQPCGGRPKGVYAAVYAIARDGATLISREVSLRID